MCQQDYLECLKNGQCKGFLDVNTEIGNNINVLYGKDRITYLRIAYSTDGGSDNEYEYNVYISPYRECYHFQTDSSILSLMQTPNSYIYCKSLFDNTYIQYSEEAFVNFALTHDVNRDQHVYGPITDEVYTDPIMNKRDNAVEKITRLKFDPETNELSSESIDVQYLSSIPPTSGRVQFMSSPNIWYNNYEMIPEALRIKFQFSHPNPIRQIMISYKFSPSPSMFPRAQSFMDVKKYNSETFLIYISKSDVIDTSTSLRSDTNRDELITLTPSTRTDITCGLQRYSDTI